MVGNKDFMRHKCTEAPTVAEYDTLAEWRRIPVQAVTDLIDPADLTLRRS